MSELGIWMVRGDIASDDVFYYKTDRPDHFIMVTKARVFKPCLVHRPEEDRKEWIPVGEYSSTRHDVVITADLMAHNTRRIIDALVLDVERAKRQAEQYEGWYKDAHREKNKLQDSLDASEDTSYKEYVLSQVRELLEKL